MLDVLPGGGLLIGSEWVSDSSGGTFDHVNPATGRVQKTIAVAGAAEVDRAVRTAAAAFPAWRRVPPDERRNILYRIGMLLKERAADLATVVTLENAIPSSFAPLHTSVIAPEFFLYYAGWTEKIEGSVIPVYPERALDYTLHEPYGVIGVISPWNGPLAAIGMKVAPALAAGNCVVLKPPNLAPFSSLAFGQICLDAGLPPGVLNVVPGGSEAGSALVRHPGVGKISFTGGSETAKSVLTAAAENLTPVVVELGGKSANIIFEDAEIDVAVETSVMLGVAAMSGQGCSLPTRLIVQDSIYSEVVDRIEKEVGGLAVGDPFDPRTVMGPVISARHCDRIMGIIDRAKTANSGRLLTGGERMAGDLADGFFIAPTVFVDVEPNSELAQQEVFGPVLSVFAFSSEDQAVALANDSVYGLAGYLWTTNLQRAHRVAEHIDAGTIGVNSVPTIPVNAPFGGYKASGYGREGGRAGLDEFLRLKNIHIPIN
jgi:aldehyde dehydrogenase (NAD+)